MFSISDWNQANLDWLNRIYENHIKSVDSQWIKTSKTAKILIRSEKSCTKIAPFECIQNDQMWRQCWLTTNLNRLRINYFKCIKMQTKKKMVWVQYFRHRQDLHYVRHDKIDKETSVVIHSHIHYAFNQYSCDINKFSQRALTLLYCILVHSCHVWENMLSSKTSIEIVSSSLSSCPNLVTIQLSLCLKLLHTLMWCILLNTHSNRSVHER